MELAIVAAASILAVAYVLPKWWMIKAQERLVQIQIDALTVGSENPAQIDFGLDGPYQ